MNNRVILIILISLGLSSYAYSQDSSEFGLKVGAGASSFFFSGTDELKVFTPKAAYQAGVYYRIDFNKIFMQSELMWITQGSGSVINPNSCVGKHILHTNYLTALFGVGFKPIEKIGVFGGLGFGGNTLNMALRKKVDINIISAEPSMYIGVNYRLTPKFTIAAKYTQGLSTVSEVSFTGGLENANPDFKLRQQGAYISISYRLSKSQE